MEQLKKQESLIHSNILKHTTGTVSVVSSTTTTTTTDHSNTNTSLANHNHQHLNPYSKRQSDFSSTCFAIEAIIKGKLYKLTAQNLEQYFLKEFNVSRAQVYRLLDCAAVLRCLEGMSPLPHKYKICKDLKQKAGLGPECKTLWQKVLDHAAASAASSSLLPADPNNPPAIRESDIESYAFDALPNISKPKKVLNEYSSFYQSSGENKENMSPHHSLKRKMSESSVGGGGLPYDNRRGSFDSHYSRRSSIDSMPPIGVPSGRGSPFMIRRESNDSIRTLVEGVYHLNHESAAPSMRKGSIGDIDSHGRPLLPPILPKRRFSEADTRSRVAGPPPPGLYPHKEEDSGNGERRAYPFQNDLHHKPPPPVLKKRVSLPGLSYINNTSRNSSTVSSPRSDVRNFTFAPQHQAPSDPIFAASKSREWNVYAHHVSAAQTQPQVIPAPILGDSDESSAIMSDFQQCQDALRRLSARGYQLTPYLGGKWYLEAPITQWRIVPASQLERREEEERVNVVEEAPVKQRRSSVLFDDLVNAAVNSTPPPPAKSAA